MKNAKNIIVLILIIGIGVFVSKHWKKQDAVSTGASETGSKPTNICYIWNTKAGDSSTLKLSTTDGVHVTGTFNYLPAEKDTKTGSVAGVVGELDQATMSQTVDLLWTSSAEGMTNIEQLYIKLGEGTAQPAYGEMKLDKVTGHYVYADTNKLTYGPAMQQTDCSDPALK